MKQNPNDPVAVLDAPFPSRVSAPDPVERSRMSAGLPPRREMAEDFSTIPARRRRPAWDEDASPDLPSARRRVSSPLRLRLRGRLPRTLIGRFAAGTAFFAIFGAAAFALWETRAAVLHDPRFVIPSSHAIEIVGNNHLTRAQLLSVFGGDVDRNLLTVPLAQRRAELEALPWVEHATVMRLLPNHLRISITERTPVAFVRQGADSQSSSIGLVDRTGTLIDLSPDAPSDRSYSFPVVTGIAESDPAGTRAARIRLYLKFLADLDSGTEKVSPRLSEVDLTDPEDIKALLPDSGGSILVHFGDEDFLTRYHRYIQNLPGWKTRYPKLASVDMRYDREVVLEMAPGSSVPLPGAAAPNQSAPPPERRSGKKTPGDAKRLTRMSAKAPGRPRPSASTSPRAPGTHLEQSFSVHPNAAPVKKQDE